MLVVAFIVAFFAAVVAILIHLSPIEPNVHVFPDPPPFLEGVLAPNRLLTKARRLHEGVIVGPESFTSDADGNVYTGSADGILWRLWPNETAQRLARTGRDIPQCGQIEAELLCGRAKGMKVVGKILWLVDSYNGLMRLDLNTLKLETVLPREKGVDGIPFRFLNSLDVASDGTIYFSSSSTKWDRKDYRLEVIELDRTGRIMTYSPKTGVARTLAANLTLANGIALSPDESSILFSEMSMHRIRRLHLRGPRFGEIETVADNMAGYPDNIKRRPGKNSYFIGFTVTRFSSPPGLLGIRVPPLLDCLAPYPAMKKLMVMITPSWAYNMFIPRHSLFVEMDESGKLLRSFHDPKSEVIYHMSEAFETKDGRIFLGSHDNPYVGFLKSEVL